MQQRVGPVRLDCDPAERDDLTVLEVPTECVGYVTGRKGLGLRSIEEEWSTLMFFTELSSKESPTERLAIFGDERHRKGAELKVMSAVDQKIPGYFTKDVNETISESDNLDHDIVEIAEENYSYALGKLGSTRKKLAAAAAAILEYVGPYAFIVGLKDERRRAREYLEWLCQQRTKLVSVDTSNRDDVAVLPIPDKFVAYVTGCKGAGLRNVEQKTSTFIFLDGEKISDTEGRLLIFGSNKADREQAVRIIQDRIKDKERDDVRGSGRRRSYYPEDESRRRSPDRDFRRDNRRDRDDRRDNDRDRRDNERRDPERRDDRRDRGWQDRDRRETYRPRSYDRHR